MRSKLLLVIYLTFISNFVFSQGNLFQGHTDVGNVGHSGSMNYDANKQSYTLSGSGTNIWFNHDAFHYAWKKMKGDFLLQARGHFIGAGKEMHRKWGWMIRASLDSTAAMVSAAVHGDGLTSLQYRKSRGDSIQEVKSSASGPDVIQLERKGSLFIMSVAHFGEPFTTEQIENIDLGDEVYAGLFVCAHNNNNIEEANFTNVRIVVPASASLVPYRQFLASHLETMNVQTGERQILYTDTGSIQAPNWTKDGRSLIFNKDGHIFQFDLAGKRYEQLNTGSVNGNNNDHVISFDGKMLGLSATSPDKKFNSVVYSVPITGGNPVQITPTGPSYFHGWSPDGKYMIYTGQRNGDFDIYRIPAKGGEEVRLTSATGLDDGSEYTPDGKYIYFNSVRSGSMQIWRMNSDGSNPVQVTSDEFNNWFPHVSPDGKWIVFISFMKDVSPSDHPFYKHVYLQLMPIEGGKSKVIAYLYGGQGTINTPSWSPDSKKIAFISNTDNKR